VPRHSSPSDRSASFRNCKAALPTAAGHQGENNPPRRQRRPPPRADAWRSPARPPQPSNPIGQIIQSVNQKPEWNRHIDQPEPEKRTVKNPHPTARQQIKPDGSEPESRPGRHDRKSQHACPDHHRKLEGIKKSHGHERTQGAQRGVRFHQEKTVCVLRSLGSFAAEICLSLFYSPAASSAPLFAR